MEEKGNGVVRESSLWETPSIQVISVRNVTMGDGSYLSDSFEGS
jgi:hypothetical protein